MPISYNEFKKLTNLNDFEIQQLGLNAVAKGLSSGLTHKFIFMINNDTPNKTSINIKSEPLDLLSMKKSYSEKFNTQILKNNNNRNNTFKEQIIKLSPDEILVFIFVVAKLSGKAYLANAAFGGDGSSHSAGEDLILFLKNDITFKNMKATIRAKLNNKMGVSQDTINVFNDNPLVSFCIDSFADEIL